MEIKNNKQIIWVPEGAAVLTAGVEVKKDRLEVEIVGWGNEEKSWSVDYRVLQGDPAEKDIWEKLDNVLLSDYEHESGVMLSIATACIGDGNQYIQQISDFVKEKQARRIWVVEGTQQAEGPVIGNPSMNNALRVKVFPVRVDALKEQINERLKIKEPGEKCMHFPVDRNEEHLKDATAEKQGQKIVRGKQTRIWVTKRPRKESLNCRIYALAAFYILNPDIQIILKSLAEYARKHQKKEPTIIEQLKKDRPRKGFVWEW